MAANVLIYEWQAWQGYMLPAILPEGIRMEADPFQSLDQILGSCQEDLRAFAFHLNCTRTINFPQCRNELLRALQERGICVLNGLVTDIGKRRLQESCRFLGLPTVWASRDSGPPSELLIVKSDLNHAGFGERHLSPVQARALGVSFRPGPIRDIDDYRILPRADVPPEWWDDPDLAIERFIENSRRRKFRTYFVGPHHSVSIWIDDHPIKRLRTAQLREEHLTSEETLAHAAHPRLPSSFQVGVVRLLQHLRMDFGAVDFVEDEGGECYAVDVNATSYGRALSAEARRHLQSGLMVALGSGLRRTPVPGAGRQSRSITEYVEELLCREKEAPVGITPALPRAVPARAQVPLPPESQPAVRAAGWYHSPGDLGVVTCLFNVDACGAKLRNFAFFSSLLRTGGIPFVVVECASTNGGWHLAPSSDVIQVRASADLWQKERLLNLALHQVPDKCTKIAWLDADLLFENPDWAVLASEALNKYKVVQLGHRIIRLPRGLHAFNGTGACWDSFASIYLKYPHALLSGDFGKHGHTGFGWAANRSLLNEVGLYDACVAGGGDHVMAHAFCGDWDSPCLGRMMGTGSAWHRHAIQWANRAYPFVRARVGAVEGHILHLWHGELPSRKHMGRYETLKEAQFDPEVDLEVDEFGCWRWRSEKPVLRAALAQYLQLRRHEGTDTRPRSAVGLEPTAAEGTRARALQPGYGDAWNGGFRKFAGKRNIHALIVGATDASSATWLLANVLQNESSRLICVGPSPPQAGTLHPFQHKVAVMEGPSTKVLRDPFFQQRSLHCVSIAGRRGSSQILQDAILTFPLLVGGGIMIFEDYLIGATEPGSSDAQSKLAANSFASVFRDQITVLHEGDQFIVAKR